MMGLSRRRKPKGGGVMCMCDGDAIGLSTRSPAPTAQALPPPLTHQSLMSSDSRAKKKKKNPIAYISIVSYDQKIFSATCYYLRRCS